MDLVIAHGKLSESTARAYFVQIVSALEYCHMNRVVRMFGVVVLSCFWCCGLLCLVCCLAVEDVWCCGLVCGYLVIFVCLVSLLVRCVGGTVFSC